jgi:osmoprotectant transport system permease protein
MNLFSEELLREQLVYLPEYLGRHLLLTVMALGTGIGLSLPLGALTMRFRALQTPVLTIASIVQTIPALALLALMVALLGRIGFMPAYIALVLYSMLPVLRNTVTGLSGVDYRVVEAARGIGMKPIQVLLKVRLPLAMPVIIAGIRTATVWTIGIATLSTPVGATSLGNYIFSGLQTQNFTAVILGCITAAVLAIVLDGLIRLLEIASTRRSGVLAVTALILLGGVIAGGVTPLFINRSGTPEGGARIVVGAKGFTEQYILGGLLAARLRDAGFDVEKRDNLGSTVVFQALRDGNVDCYVDYTGTIWANHMNRDGNPGSEAMLREVKAWLKREHGIAAPGVLGFENAYALAMKRAAAEERTIETIPELADQSGELVMGSDFEFFSRPEWKSLQTVYDLAFSEKRSLDPALMYSAVDRGRVDVISAFSTDGRIAAYDLKIIQDTEEALPPYDAIVLVAPEMAEDKAFLDALAPIFGAIDDRAMREANRMVDVDNQSVTAAIAYLEEKAGS